MLPICRQMAALELSESHVWNGGNPPRTDLSLSGAKVSNGASPGIALDRTERSVSVHKQPFAFGTGVAGEECLKTASPAPYEQV